MAPFENSPSLTAKGGITVDDDNGANAVVSRTCHRV